MEGDPVHDVADVLETLALFGLRIRLMLKLFERDLEAAGGFEARRSGSATSKARNGQSHE
jgi:hypothetical protein